MEQKINQSQGWEKIPLKEILRVEIGDSQATSDIADSKGTIPYIQSSDINNTKDIRIRLHTTIEKLQARKKDLHQKVLADNRLLLTTARRGTAGRVGICKKTAIHSQAIAALIPIVPIDLDFLFHYFRYKQSLVAHEVEQQGKPRITKTYLENIHIPIPPGSVEKQKDIVKQIEDRLVEIEQSYKIIEDVQHEITNIFDKAMSNIFTRQIDQRSNKQIIQLRKLVDPIQEKVIPQNAQHDSYTYIDETHITPAWGILHTQHTWQERQDSYEGPVVLLEQAKDIVVCYKSNVSARLAVILNVEKALCSATMIPLRVRQNSLQKILPAFLLWSLLSEPFLTFAMTNSQGKTQTKLSENKLLSYPLPLPDIDVQHEIVNNLTHMQETTQKMREIANDSRNKLAQVERAIYQKAFTEEL